MIPIKLTLNGFLSYREETTIDFSALNVACISGANGAGKSSLFDAITWVLFGKARRNDDEALINDSLEACQVALEFDYENNRYRVERGKQKGKGAQLEFQIQSTDGSWKPLTEAGLRLTEERIRSVLHLDYDTFINSSFFLQGKADMFTQQTPAKRKEILSNILGLEVWEQYREETSRRRRAQEDQQNFQQQILEDILAELAEEPERKEKLDLLSQNLKKTAALRSEKEKNWQIAQANAEKNKAEKDQLTLVSNQLESNRKRLEQTRQQIGERQAELKQQEQIAARDEEISRAYQAWQKLRQELEKWNALADEFHQMQQQRATFDAQIQTEEARLQQEQKSLLEVKKDIEAASKKLPALQNELGKDQLKLSNLEQDLNNLPSLEEKLSSLQAGNSELVAENLRLKDHMQELEKDIKSLRQAGGSACPLCGQALTDSHRQNILAQLETQGKTLGDQYRENSRQVKTNKEAQVKIHKEIVQLRSTQSELTTLQRLVGQKDQQASDIQTRLDKWQREGAPCLAELGKVLDEKTFAKPVRAQLQQVDMSIQKLGYQPQEHEKHRKDEREARTVEEAYRDLEKAKTAIEAFQREIGTLLKTQKELEKEVTQGASLQEELSARLKDQRESLPDMEQAQADLKQLREEENNLRQEVGAAQQMVDVLDKQRNRKKEIEAAIKNIKQAIANFKVLEQAFGKDGVPALLIEQSLPEIETQANDILDRLSSGRMSITFMTEREYKDKKREDKKQTLDIIISDASGQRAYELFSGGEAFRINFAIRLALSRVLAQRAGARLQTLVIDEGFGSQDAEGRQRLIEAINLVSQDFAKILVITHLDELKDAFPSRIEVQKTQHGSIVEVIP